MLVDINENKEHGCTRWTGTSECKVEEDAK